MSFSNPRKAFTLRPKMRVELTAEEEEALAVQQEASRETQKQLKKEAQQFLHTYLKLEHEPVWTKKMAASQETTDKRRDFYEKHPEVVNELYKEVRKQFFRCKIRAGVEPGDLFERDPHSEKHGHVSDLPEEWKLAAGDDTPVYKYVKLYEELKNAILARYPDPNEPDDKYRETIVGLLMGAENDIREELKSGKLKVGAKPNSQGPTLQ